ncbi:hypothetical protein SOM61_07895 [Massilia sp. CFBP9012]|uniref:hypothetical protein n=1 Tax=Massilia sp. CFBP9012 TaxID=3096531 RepID=UPI002A699F76|nr:hypothetical protein [Massilia sp. CFBP9012]MDY0974881.1 hypothetical protein [Massilia sp. CFBP9012]
MNDADEWARLQDAWGADAPVAPLTPDVTAMIARARRQRRLIVLTILGEWMLAAVGAGMLIRDWPRATANGFMLLWWVYFLLFMVAVMISYTWTRLQALREPPGNSLRDWLGLRRRRALLSLRLVRLTRWSTIPMLPAPFLTLYTGRDAWSAAWTSAAVGLLLAGGWLWAWDKARRMKAELAEVDALAREWLDEPQDESQDGTTTA